MTVQWDLGGIRECWWRAVRDHASPHREEDGRVVLVGDGVKQAKEARRMPGVKRLHQESEDCSKAEYIFGHMFGAVGMLAERLGHFVCVPLSIRLHDGLREAAGWFGDDAISTSSHVVQMIEDACRAARVIGSAILLLDRHFLSREALETLRRLSEPMARTVDIVTRARMNCVAYEKPEPRKPGQRGAPRKKGATLRLKDLFETRAEEFTSVEAELHGKEARVEYLCLSLLWGRKLCRELRFVLARTTTAEGRTARAIFVCTDLELDPARIIKLYSYRFKIEICFRELKQQIGAFCYRFWTRGLEKLGRFLKKDEAGPLEKVEDEHARRKVLQAARAIEMHVMIGCVAMGVLQMITLQLAGEADSSGIRFQRTPST